MILLGETKQQILVTEQIAPNIFFPKFSEMIPNLLGVFFKIFTPDYFVFCINCA
jgi:hypothetical protein